MNTNQMAEWPDIPRRRNTMSENLTCPRCGKDTMHPEPVRNARSRVDDETLICNACGTSEALLDYSNPGGPMTKDSWVSTIEAKLDAANPTTKVTFGNGEHWVKHLESKWHHLDSQAVLSARELAMRVRSDG